tara:strand:- start:13299 stop:14873 length:1575 start_codon:yes stop_codon:yes gene_type:complete
MQVSQSTDGARVGPCLDNYTIIGEIARGGMGIVYLCQRTGRAGFKRLFAVKVMHEQFADQQDFVNMLLDEARIAAQIHHHNVVSVVDIGSAARGTGPDQDQPYGHYIVMDYVEGCSLGQTMNKASWPDIRLVAPLMIDTLRGLHAAHVLEDELGMPLKLVHRDVSPGNILIGVDGVARITDFGIAKAMDRITLTQPGTHKGKLAYASPEQITGEVIDARSDVFALGSVMWSVLTSKRLFQGDNGANTIHNIMNMVIARPSIVGMKPPDCYDEIVLKALSRNPDDRYQSAEEMADAIREAAIENNLLASSAEVGAWIQDKHSEKLALRRQAIAANTLVDGLEIPSLPGVSAVDEPEFSSLSTGQGVPSKIVQENRGSSQRNMILAGAIVLLAGIAGFVLFGSSDPPEATRDTSGVSSPQETTTPKREAARETVTTRALNEVAPPKEILVDSPGNALEPQVDAGSSVSASQEDEATSNKKQRRKRKQSKSFTKPAAAIEKPEPPSLPKKNDESLTPSLEQNPYLRK